MLYQTLSHTPKLAPLLSASQRTLNNYACFYSEILTKAPQQVWQTLKNFDYPLLTAKATDFFMQQGLCLS